MAGSMLQYSSEMCIYSIPPLYTEVDWCDAHKLVCRHFDYTREGGRASQRVTDFVRRRLWRKKAVPSDASVQTHMQNSTNSDGVQQAARAMAKALVSPTTVMSSARYHTHLPCSA